MIRENPSFCPWNFITFITFTQNRQTSQATAWPYLMPLFHRPYRCLQLCSEDFSFLSPEQPPKSFTCGWSESRPVCAANVWSFDMCLSTVCGFLPSTGLAWPLSGSFLWQWACHKVSDLPICYFSEEWKRPLGGLRLALLISLLLRSDARTIVGEECARLHTSCESSKQLSVQISATHPLVWFLWAYAFLFALNAF